MAVPLLSKKTVKKRVKKFKQPQSDRKISVKVILLVFILALCIRLWSKGMATATPSGVGIASRVISPCRSISHLLCLFLLMLKQTSLIVGVEAEKLVGVSALDMFEAADDEAMCCSILMHRYLNLEICIDMRLCVARPLSRTIVWLVELNEPGSYAILSVHPM
ncbi:uncharacterized protein [Coffea arabica]|uniref:Uncharacterized protein isoform X2 n=1 Tax=Coffea arabica TaxID=13443 RepID=A0ABM4UNN3_COFAR